MEFKFVSRKRERELYYPFPGTKTYLRESSQTIQILSESPRAAEREKLVFLDLVVFGANPRVAWVVVVGNISVFTHASGHKKGQPYYR